MGITLVLFMKFVVFAAVFAAIVACALAMPVSVPENDIECSICEFVVGEVDKLAGSNKTEAEVEAEIVKACNILPKSWGGECTSLVDEYFPQIWQLIVQEGSDPSQICTEIKLCTPSTPKVEVVGGVECNLCTLAASAIEKYVAENKTLAEIEHELDDICKHTPWDKDCEAFVDEYTQKIINAILSGDTPAELCAELGLCSGEEEIVEKKVVDVAPIGDTECTLCEFVVNFVETKLNESSTQQEIETELGKVCKLLPGDFGATCVSLVDNYLPAIIEHIENDFPPATACAALGLCPKAAPKVAAAPIGDTECTLCEFAVNFVETKLNESSTQTEIETELGKVCKLLPGDLGSTCVAIVDNYLPAIIEHIENDFPPATACAALGLCPKAYAPKAPKADSKLCSVCELIVQEAESLLAGKNINNTEIEDKLEALCGDLPSDFQPECKLAVTVLLPTLLTDLESGKPADQVCQTVHLCPSSSALKQHKLHHGRRAHHNRH